MEPYKTNPVMVERVWGGLKLSEYNKSIGMASIGESWETGLIDSSKPVLIKFIDAKDNLSVQVHPDDDFALKAENANNGKSEAWVILECEEDAFIIYGFRRAIKKEELSGLLREGQISEVLNHIKVRKGDCIYIPAGTVHSLGKGILAYEVQQPSELTYRLYDWDRSDPQGKRRELQIEKALDAINYSIELPSIVNIYDSLKDGFFDIIKCKHFETSIRRIETKESHSYKGGKFRAVTAVLGYAALWFYDSKIIMQKGDTCIIPREFDATVRIEGLETSEYFVTTCNI